MQGVEHISMFHLKKRLTDYIIFIGKRLPIDRPGQNVLISISTFNPQRRLLQVISHFLYCGYRCCIDISFLRYLKLDKYGGEATLFTEVYPARKKNTSYSVVISDDKKKLEQFDSAVMKIHLNFHMFEHLNSVTSDDLFYPIVSHKKYNNSFIESDVLSKSITKKRRIGAIFVGNNDFGYNKSITKELFGINTRDEVFNCICTNVSDVYIPRSLNEFVSDIEYGLLKNKIVLLITTNKFEIPSDKYLDILLESNFYIHMSGHIQPYCHNQIESMMSGCIPITQFARFFIPPFQHEENSLLYNTLDELIELLKKIASGHYTNKIEFMRENIIHYYKKYYSLVSFKKKISHLIDSKVDYTNYYIALGNDHFLSKTSQEIKRAIKND